MTAAVCPLLTPNGPRIGTRGPVRKHEAWRLTLESSPGLNGPVSLHRSSVPVSCLLEIRRRSRHVPCHGFGVQRDVDRPSQRGNERDPGRPNAPVQARRADVPCEPTPHLPPAAGCSGLLGCAATQPLQSDDPRLQPGCQAFPVHAARRDVEHYLLILVNRGDDFVAVHDEKRFHCRVASSLVAVNEGMIDDDRDAQRCSLVCYSGM